MASKQSMPQANTPARAEACASVYRLAAVALGHPVPELQEALVDGRFHTAFNEAWYAVTGREWPASTPSKDFKSLETGYIGTFLHGRKGRPCTNLLAGDYGSLLKGVSRSTYMLNIQAFYKNFGLKAALADEGRKEEPDHLIAMLEFMVVLHHLEAEMLERGNNPENYRRAQRDFLQRYLLPLFEAIYQKMASQPDLELDATLVQLIEDFPHWLRQQLSDLGAQVGPCDDLAINITKSPRIPAENLWS